MTKRAVAPPHEGKWLDAGCGGTMQRIALGYDVFTDIVEPEAGLPGTYVKCPLEKMPFKDKEFEYVRCYHAIEHCKDPDAACAELVRIAKAGRISFPPAQAELMFGRREHRWFVFIDFGTRLLFVKKQHPSYGIPSQRSGCQKSIDFNWEGGFEWRTIRG